MVTLKRDNSAVLAVVQTSGGKKKRNRIWKKVWNVLLTSHPLTIFASVASTRTLGLRKKDWGGKVHLWHICLEHSRRTVETAVHWPVSSNEAMCLLWLSENRQTNESKNPVKKITGLTVIAPLNLHFGSILVLSLSWLRNWDLYCITEPLVLKDYNYLFSVIMHSQGEVIFKLTSKTQISKVACRGLCIKHRTNGDAGQNYMPHLDQRLSYAMGFTDGDKQDCFHSLHSFLPILSCLCH